MPQIHQKTTQKAPKVKVKKRLAKKKAMISNRVKKIFNSEAEAFNVVMFDYSKSDTFFDVPVQLTSGSAININIVSHPLDQYASPHLLNLSAQKYIERVRPRLDNNIKINYQDLPGGNFLEKIQVFELLDFEQSEILNSIKKLWTNLVFISKKPFYQINISPKLPLSKKTSKPPKFTLWQEVFLINFIIFITAKIGLVLKIITQILSQTYAQKIAPYARRDEVIDFPSAKAQVSPALSAPMNTSSRWAPPSFKFKPFWWKFSFSKILDNLSINQVSLKPLLAFLVVALIIAIPIRSYFYLQTTKETKGQVLGQAEEALGNLESAQNALSDFNLGEAEKYLISANRDFISAQDQLNEIKSFLTVLAETIPLNNTFRSGKNLLDLGEKLTKAGEYLIAGLNDFSSESDFSLASRIKNFEVSNHEALDQLKSAQENLNKININHLPKENRAKFLILKENLPKFITSLEKSDAIMKFAIDFLGEKDLKKYLIIFQNDNELRASGGFMGSLALADFKNGNLEGITMPAGGTYDLRAGLTKLLQSPEPLRLINPKWEFQDTNWWSDWPTSAQNIAYFYNKSEGATIDGVIAINSDWLGSLLAVVGPIDMPDYQKTITSANFELELQKSVELEYTDKKQPKKILGDLAPKLIENIFNVSSGNILGLVSAFNQGLKEKDIQIYMFDENEQQFVVENNWAGRMKDTAKDYLSVVATNVGGGKTDSVVDQEIYHQAKILEDGSVIASLVIKRNNFGPTDEIFTTVPNRSFIRVYTPLGSELLQAEGFKRPADKEFRALETYLEPDPKLLNERLATTHEPSLTKIYNENNKTVFANWVTIKPGESQEVLLVYKLPFKISVTGSDPKSVGLINKIKAAFAPSDHQDSYSLLVQKQAGSNDDKFVSQVLYPDGVLANISYPNQVDDQVGFSTYGAKLAEDLFYFVGLKN